VRARLRPALRVGGRPLLSLRGLRAQPDPLLLLLCPHPRRLLHLYVLCAAGAGRQGPRDHHRRARGSVLGADCGRAIVVGGGALRGSGHGAPVELAAALLCVRARSYGAHRAVLRDVPGMVVVVVVVVSLEWEGGGHIDSRRTPWQSTANHHLLSTEETSTTNSGRGASETLTVLLRHNVKHQSHLLAFFTPSSAPRALSLFGRRARSTATRAVYASPNTITTASGTSQCTTIPQSCQSVTIRSRVAWVSQVLVGRLILSFCVFDVFLFRVNNCIGLRNYRWFILFLAMHVVACCYCAYLCGMLPISHSLLVLFSQTYDSDAASSA
jgi:hypothetical protein